MAREYWFAYYRRPWKTPPSDKYYQILALWIRSGVPRPISVEGWVSFWGTIIAMTGGGGMVFLARADDAISRGWIGLAYGGWVLTCIVVSGLLMNWKADPNKPAEEYVLDASSQKLEN